MADRGTYLEGEIRAAIKHYDWQLGKLHVLGHAQPYDFGMLTPNIFLAIEAKSTAILSSFPFSRLAPHQKAGLLKANASKAGIAYVLLGFRSVKETTQKKIKGKVVKSTIKKRRCLYYAINIKDFADLEEELIGKSIPEKMYESDKRFIKLTKVGGILNLEILTKRK